MSDIVEASWDVKLADTLIEMGVSNLVREAYLFVGDVKKSDTWRYPVKQLLEGETLGTYVPILRDTAKALVSETSALVLPKRLAAQRLVRLFKDSKISAPDDLLAMTKFESLEEAFAEAQMLALLGDSSGVDELKFTVVGLGLTGTTPAMPSLDELKETINSLKGITSASVGNLRHSSPDQLDSDGDTDSAPIKDDAVPPDTLEDPMVPGGSGGEDLSPEAIKRITYARKKGLPDSISADGKYVGLMRSLTFANKGRTLKDYYADDKEIAMWNALSGIDIEKEDLIVVSSESANTEKEPDSQGDIFLQQGIDEMAMGCPDTPLLKDHNWTTDNTVGKCFAGSSADGVFRQKFGILNLPENKFLITNVLNRVFGKVSVGFTAPLDKLMCMSCKGGETSIYDEACPHNPGEVDAKGKQVVVGIGGIGRYCETSLVAVPAVAKASIGLRSFTPKGAYAKTLNTIPSVKTELSKEPVIEEVIVSDATTPDKTKTEWGYTDDPLQKLPGSNSDEPAQTQVADLVDVPTSVSIALDPSDAPVDAPAPPKQIKAEDAPAEAPADPAVEDKAKDLSDVTSLKSVVGDLAAIVAELKELIVAQKALYGTFTPAADLVKRADETETNLKNLSEIVEAAIHFTLESAERQRSFAKTAEPASKTDYNNSSVKTVGSLIFGGQK